MEKNDLKKKQTFFFEKNVNFEKNRKIVNFSILENIREFWKIRNFFQKKKMWDFFLNIVFLRDEKYFCSDFFSVIKYVSLVTPETI